MIFLFNIVFCSPNKGPSKKVHIGKGILTGSGVVDGVIQIVADEVDAQLIDDQSREHDVPLVEDRLLVFVRDRRVHQRVGSDEIQDGVRQRFCVVDALARPRFRNLVGQDRQPRAAAGCLLFELSAESLLDGVDVEGTYRGAH